MIRYARSTARSARSLRAALVGLTMVVQLLPSSLPTIGAAAHAAFHAAEELRRSAGPLAHHRPGGHGARDRAKAHEERSVRDHDARHAHEGRDRAHAHSRTTDVPHAPDARPHTHGAESAPHTHAPLVDRLRAASSEAPSGELALPGSTDVRVDDHVPVLHPVDGWAPVIVALRRDASTPAPTLSAPPPTPPPRA